MITKILTALKNKAIGIIMALLIATIAIGGGAAYFSLNSMESKVSSLTEQVTSAKEDAADAKLQAQGATASLESYKKASQIVVNSLDSRGKMREEEKQFSESLDEIPKANDRPYDNINNLYYATRVRDYQQRTLDQLNSSGPRPSGS